MPSEVAGCARSPTPHQRSHFCSAHSGKRSRVCLSFWSSRFSTVARSAHHNKPQSSASWAKASLETAHARHVGDQGLGNAPHRAERVCLEVFCSWNARQSVGAGATDACGVAFSTRRPSQVRVELWQQARLLVGGRGTGTRAVQVRLQVFENWCLCRIHDKSRAVSKPC